MTDGQTFALLVISCSVWVVVPLVAPALFPNNKWSDLKRFFCRRKK